jgi:hypothetical protein
MAWFDFMNQANARGRDAGSIARQRLNARAGMPAPGLPAISTSLARVAGFNTAALSPLLDSAHWAKEQMRKARLIPDISSIQYRPVRYPELNRPDYSGAGERARRFEEYKTGRDIPGANTNYSSRLNNGSSTGSPAAERDYQQKVSRVAQLTAQDPELQRYEYARQKAKLAGPGSAAEQSAEDLGMQMWAKANPTLAKQVTPGQSGFDAIYKQVGRMPATSFNPLMDRTFGYQTGGGPVTGGQETLGPIPLIPQVDQSLNPASPTFIGGEGPPLMDFSRDNLTPEMIEKYQRQLLQQAKPK